MHTIARKTSRISNSLFTKKKLKDLKGNCKSYDTYVCIEVRSLELQTVIRFIIEFVFLRQYLII